MPNRPDSHHPRSGAWPNIGHPQTAAYTQALTHVPVDTPTAAHCRLDLGAAHLAHWRERGRSDDLDTAIEHWTFARTATGAEPDVVEAATGNLAAALWERYETRHDERDLDQAVDLLIGGLDRPKPRRRPGSCSRSPERCAVATPCTATRPTSPPASPTTARPARPGWCRTPRSLSSPGSGGAPGRASKGGSWTRTRPTSAPRSPRCGCTAGRARRLTSGSGSARRSGSPRSTPGCSAALAGRPQPCSRWNANGLPAVGSLGLSAARGRGSAGARGSGGRRRVGAVGETRLDERAGERGGQPGAGDGALVGGGGGPGEA